MSYILYALEFSSAGTSSEDDSSTFSHTVTQQVTLDLVLSDAEVEIQPQVKNYLLNVFSKSLPTSSHVQTVSWMEEKIEKHATVYYQQLTSSPSQIMCLVCEGKVSLTAFYHELDRFTDIVRDLVLEKGVGDPGVKDLLDKWYSECISYVLRVVDYFRLDLPPFLYTALSRNDIQITRDNPPQRVKDTHKFLSACSLKELIYNTAVCVREAEDEEDLMIDISGSAGRVIGTTNNFCSKWAELIEFESDPFVVRQIIEDYKLLSNQDMNIFRRLLRQAETDHYAFFQAYEFIRLHDNGDILLDLALHETTVYSIVGAEELLTILRDFMIKKKLCKVGEGV